MMGEKPPELSVFRNLALGCLFVFLFSQGPLVRSTEIYEDAGVPTIQGINSTLAFDGVRCETNSSRFININFTLLFVINNDTIDFKLTTNDGYVVYTETARESDALEELFLMGASFINNAITTVKGENVVTLGSNASVRAEFHIKEKKVIAETKDVEGSNACFVIAYGNITGTWLQVDRSVVADWKDDLGLGALHWAAMFGDAKVTKKLLDLGTDVNAMWERESATPLHFAAIRGDKEIVKLLVEHGADLEAKDVESMSILDAAIYANQTDVVEQLLGLGANFSAGNPVGRTPLHIAAQRGNRRAVELLTEAGAEVDARDSYGRTPLIYAIESYQKGTVSALVERGAEVDFPSLVKSYGEVRVNELLGNHTTIVE